MNPASSEAKRAGGGKSVGKQSDTLTSSQAVKNRADEVDSTKPAGGTSIPTRPGVSTVAGGVAAGVAGATAARAFGAAADNETQQGERAKENEEKRVADRAAADLERKIKEEELRAVQNARTAAAEKAAAVAAEEQRKKEAQREAEKARQQATMERERSCVIQPVMSNEEIEHCKIVWR